MYNDSIVPNSEASDEEVVIPLCSELDSVSVNNTGDESNFEAPLAVPASKATVLEQHGIEQYSNSIRRALRKRKAIQKMPYSLDRIRHRQMLQGYDVSNFDSVADNIDLLKDGYESPKKQQQKDINTSQISSSVQDIGYQEEGSVFSIRQRRHHHVHLLDDDMDDEEDETTMAQSSFNINTSESDNEDVDDDPRLSQENNVLFRGRQINLKTGYKGLLPKIAWEKALNSNGVTARYKERAERKLSRNQAQINEKGLAKRKVIRNKNASLNEKDLLNEIVESDNEEDMPSAESFLKLMNEEQSKLERSDTMKDYFLKKYEPEMDTNSEDEDHVDSDALDIPNEGLELLTLEDTDKVDLGTIIIDDSEDKIDVERSRHATGVIDFMLSKNTRHSTDKMASNKPRIKNTGNKSSVHSKLFEKKRTRNTARSHTRGRISLMRKTNSSTASLKSKPNTNNSANNTFQNSHSSNYDLQLDGTTSREQSFNEPVIIKNDDTNEKNTHKTVTAKKKKKPKNRLFTVAPTSNAELNRKAMTFSTVVEEESGKFTLRKPPIKKRSFTLDDDKLLSEDNSTSTISSSLWKAIESSSEFPSPDIIRLTLNTKEYVISKFGSNSDNTVQDLLESLIKYGGSDEEVKDLAKNLSEFLFSWNSSTIYDIIDRFHHEFRAKVNTLRERAKPIHFFLIASCQLFFLEISRYASCSLFVKNQMSEKITDHIVSFFKLYSKSGTKELDPDDPIMSEALVLLSRVVTQLDCKEILWQKIRKNKFSTLVSTVIVETFPTLVPSWDIVKVKQEYEDAVAWIKFIGICSNEPYEWDITNELALDLYEFFKMRKFEDFPQETVYQVYPVVPFPDDESRVTLFNTFINILESCTFKTSTLEKLTAMSKIHNLHSPSLLANRLNLLLTLASKSDYSYERRFEELLEPYIMNNDITINNTMLKIMLEGALSFYKISYEKGYTVRGKFVPLLWKKVNIKYSSMPDKIWRIFWKEFQDIIPQMKKSRVFLLKSFQPILHQALNLEKKLNQTTKLLNIYVDNLSVLDLNWIQTHVLQILVSKAKGNVVYLHYYCKIAKFLTVRNNLTWWSLFHYNAFEENQTISINYYSFLAFECDENTFSQMKHILYQKILAYLLKKSDHVVVNLINTMSKRDPKMKLKIRLTTINENTTILKQLLIALNTSGYTFLFDTFLDDLKTVFFSDSSKYASHKEIVLFLNYNIIDVVRLNPVFIHLRSIFGIDDEESENSALREYLRTLPSDKSRLLYLIERIASTLENKMSIMSLMLTMKKVVKDKCFDDEIVAFSSMMYILPLNTTQCQLAPVFILRVIFLKMLNDRIELYPLRPSENRPESLMKLGYFLSNVICYYSKLLDRQNLDILKREHYRFFYNLLRLLFGFSQYSTLKSFLQMELSCALPDFNTNLLASEGYPDTAFEKQIIEILSKYSFSNFDIKEVFPTQEPLYQEVNYLTKIEREFI